MDLGFTPAAHHRLICEKLEAVERGEISRLMVFMPPGSAKSTYGSILFPSWYLGRNPRKTVLASSHTTDLAEKFGRRVRNTLMEPAYQVLFDTRLAADSQAAGRWSTSDGGEYYAAGVGSAILGYRADLGLIDDPVSGREAADSERSREKTWEWFKSDFETRLKPGAAIVLIMQRWHEDDLAGRLLDRAKTSGEQWHILRLPMESEEDDPLGRQPGEPLWPEWFTDDMRALAKGDARNWMALYQQRPRPDSGGEFKRDWIRYHDGGVTPAAWSHCNKYILVDAANGKRPNNDFTSIWVIALGEDENYYVVDMVRDKLNLTERANRVMALHRKWKPIHVRYERYGLMADTDYIRELQKAQNYRFDLVEVAGAMPKNDRIRRLIPLFERSKVYLPDSYHATDHTGAVRNLVHDFLEEEYAAFPVGRHDDMLDSLARIAEPDLPLLWPMPESADRDELEPAVYADT